MTKMIEMVIALSFPLDPKNYHEGATDEEILAIEIEACNDDAYSFVELMDNVTGKIVEQEEPVAESEITDKLQESINEYKDGQVEVHELDYEIKLDEDERKD